MIAYLRLKDTEIELGKHIYVRIISII